MDIKISVIEEVSPEAGLTEAEIKAGIWNSPPATKGQGRYLIQGKTISPADFAALKSKDMVNYWNQDFLEDCDMFTTSPGWRIYADGLSFLKSRGYEIEIDTIEAREKANQERLAQRKIDNEKKAIAEKEVAEQYKKDISEYETWLGSPKWVADDGKKHGKGAQTNLKTIQRVGDEQYTDYGLTPAGFIHVFQHINNDWWNHVYSELPAPAHVIEEAQKIKVQQEAEEQKRKDAWEKEKKHRLYVHYICPRCGRQIYVNKAEAERNKSVRCGKCHTGKKATDATTVEYQIKEDVEFQHIPADAERK
jgi:DNA-directed RNA polymerase subunit RPC12/RpoP